MKGWDWSQLKINPDSIWESFKIYMHVYSTSVQKGSEAGPTEESCIEDFWKLKSVS